MQASLQDLQSPNRNRESFLICQRTLLHCHEIIFGDLPPPATTPYLSVIPTAQSRFARKKVKVNASPALVGMGIVLLGSPGLPAVTEATGEVVIEQGRADNNGSGLKSLGRLEDDTVQGGVVTASRESMDDEDEAAGSSQNGSQEDLQDVSEEKVPSDSGVDSNGRRLPRSRRRTIGAAHTTPALHLHLRKPRLPRFSDDPLGQLDHTPPTPGHPFQSSPSLPSLQGTNRSGSLNAAELLLARYDFQSQIELLRSHFCRTEVGVAYTITLCVSQAFSLGSIPPQS